MAKNIARVLTANRWEIFKNLSANSRYSSVFMASESNNELETACAISWESRHSENSYPVKLLK